MSNPDLNPGFLTSGSSLFWRSDPDSGQLAITLSWYRTELGRFSFSIVELMNAWKIAYSAKTKGRDRNIEIDIDKKKQISHWYGILWYGMADFI